MNSNLEHRKKCQDAKDRRNAQRKWKTKHPDTYKASYDRYNEAHRDTQGKYAASQIDAIVRMHDEDLKDDVERLDIRELIDTKKRR